MTVLATETAPNAQTLTPLIEERNNTLHAHKRPDQLAKH
jgi:hypothetical protein